jgi:tetratricopeptide (TPR) repeat protein
MDPGDHALSAAVRLALPVLSALLAAGCGSLIGPPYQPAPAPQPMRPAPTPAPAPSTPLQTAPPPPAPAPPPSAPSQQPSREYHLGAAASALVEQARQQAAGGAPQIAQATLERALRIEPENPLLWIMLGEAHESAGQYALAGSMGRKALQLATGDPRAEASAWRLIGDSLHARGRNPEANEAYSRADALAAR